MDGGGIDVWVGSLESKALDAVALTVDLKKRDAELKLLLGCSEAEQQMILEFLDDYSMSVLLVRRGGEGAFLRSRRSVRRFRAKPIPQDVLECILETATWAPSAHNRQPWRFAALVSPQAKSRLAETMGADFHHDLLADGLSEEEAESQVARSRQRITEAPAAILLCLDTNVGDSYPDPRRQWAEALMGAQGVAMAGQNLLLAAQAEGLGGVWMCAPLFAPQTVRAALELPKEWQPQGLILLGYPARIPEARPRRPVAEVTRFL
jgi:F420 biosynthesis protein FbiB-like protein